MSKKRSTPLGSPRRLTMALEPRQLFDGAVPVVAASALQEAGATARDTPVTQPVDATPHEVIIVDSRVDQGWQRAQALGRAAQLVVVDQQSDGLSQIAAALAGQHDLTAIHVLSHGERDGLLLGRGLIDVGDLPQQSGVLAMIGSTLSKDGDILLYGCDVAADGRAFIDTLARLSGADVAASSNATGSVAYGGDWTLEAKSGPIETASLLLNEFDGLLAPPNIVDSGGTRSTTEDTPLTLTGISITDADGNSQTVTLNATHGTLTLHAGSGVNITGGADGSAAMTFTGTLTQVNAALNGLQFAPSADYFGAASISLTTHDGSTTVGPTAVNLTVTPVDDVPVVTADTIVSAEDGATASGNVLSNDVNVDAPADTLTIIALRTGTLAGSGTAGSIGNPLLGVYGSLTVSADGSYHYDIDNTLASVQALAAGQTVNERFVYTLTDGHTAVSGQITVDIAGNNDAPTILGSPATIAAPATPENASEAENPGALVSTLLVDVDGHSVVTDVDAGTNLGIAVFGSSTTNGMTGHWQYSLDGTIWTSVAVPFSSSAALLLPSTGKLRFVADNNADDTKESGVATIQYYAWDGSSGAPGGTADVGTRGGVTSYSSTHLNADFVVTTRNDAPTLTPTALTLNESMMATITASQLPVSDPDNGDDQLTYRITTLPSHGVLLKDGIPVVLGTLFTQADVTANRIQYQHTGSELSADASDSVTFSLRDGAGAVLNNVVLPITIHDVNAAIAITGTTQTVPERVGPEATDYSVLNLGLSDADGDASAMTLTVTSLPDPLVGRLQYWNGSAYVDVAAPLSLTKAELLAHPLHFISSGAEPVVVPGSDFAGPARPTASFTVSASDHHPLLTPSTDSQTVTLTIEPRNDPPQPLTHLLTAQQGGPAVAIDEAHLTASDLDSPVADRLYTLSSIPTHGALRLNGVLIGVGSTFSQDDLIHARLSYTQDGSATDNDPLTADDSFNFSVNDKDGAVAGGTLPINVAPNTPIAPSPAGTLSAIIAEGSFSPLNTTTLTGSNQYTLSDLPDHGTLYLNGIALGLGGTFSQAQLASGQVVYVNDGSEPSAYAPAYLDTFSVSRSGGVVGGSSTIDLTVTPVDDAPIIHQTQQTLALNEGGTTLLEESAVSGVNDFTLTGVSNAVKLTTAQLLAQDVDSGIDTLSYVLESAPSGGELRRWNAGGSVWLAMSAGERFAAADVASGKIAYFHSAGSELRHDAISVYLVDGSVAEIGDILISPPTISEQGFVTVSDGDHALAVNKGQIGRSPSRMVNFTVSNVNDPPVASNGSFVVEEGYDIDTIPGDDNPGRIHVLDATLLAASDSDNALAGATYAIVGLPAHGALQIDHGGGFSTVNAGDLGGVGAQFTLAMLTGGKLRYVQDGSDTVLTDSFTWRVNDNATDSPTAQDSNIATVNITIQAYNDPPVIFHNTGTSVPEGGVKFINTDMLGSAATGNTDVDNSNRQTQFRITSAVQNGTLYLDKGGTITVLGAGAAFTLGDIQDGYLRYRHNGSETAPASVDDDRFSFAISDAGGGNEPAGTFVIDVLPVNDAPQLTGLNPLTYFEDDGPTIIDPSVLFNDVDLANGLDYGPGTRLTIAYSAGGTASDQLSLSNLGSIHVVANDVRYNGVSIGTIDAIKDGVNGHDLQITFNSNADVVAVKALLENLTFQNTDTANASQVSAEATRTLSYTFVDGGGTASYTDDALVVLSGVDTVTTSNTILVKQRNDAPVLSDGDTTMTSISEDDTTHGSSLAVASLLGGISDVDNGFVKGIAITATVAGNGTWQYSLNSTNGLDGIWSDVGSVSDTASRLLAPTAYVRFIPDGKNATSANFTYCAWDQTSGSVGGHANSSLRGGTTAFSSESNVVSLSVSAVNDAPVLDPGTALGVSQNEDAGAPVNGVTTGSALVSSLLSGVSDVDNGALAGVAITAADTSLGSWYYSTDDGATWNSVGAVADNHALLLAPTDRLYFQPLVDVNGSVATGLSVRAWDQTSGTHGTLVDTTTHGGTTAYSTATDSVSLTVNAVNDAPTLNIATPAFTYGTENGTVAVTGVTIDDPDLARGESPSTTPPMQVRLSVAGGNRLNLTLNGSVLAGGALDSNDLTLQGTRAQINNALATLTYTTGDDPSLTDTLSIVVNDRGNVGSGGPLTASGSIALNGIVPVNDAPTSAGPGSVAATEDTVFHFTGGSALSIADPDARNGEMKVTLSIPTGTLTLGTTTGITFAAGTNGSGSMEIHGTLANLNAALASLSYTPTADANSLNIAAVGRTLTFDVNDQGYGEDGVAVGALSAGTRNIVINIAAVNDSPTLDVAAAPGIQATGALNALESRDGSTKTVVDGITLADDRDILDSGYGNVHLDVSAVHGTLSLDPSAVGVSALVVGRTVTLSGTVAAINVAIASGYLAYLPDTNFSGHDTLSLTFHDQGNSGSGGDQTAAGTIAVTVTGINDAPALSGLGGGSPDVTFVEDGSAVVLDANATLTDPELTAYDNWGGAILTLQRSAASGNPGTPAADDHFSVTGSGSTGVNFNAANIRIGTTVVGTFSQSSGVLTLTFNDGTTGSQANQVLQAITYSNSNDNPPSQVTIGYTIDDGNTNSGPTAQGNGGALSGSGAVTVGITAVNDPPVLTLGAPTPSLQEDGAPIVLAPSATLADPELSFFGGQSGDWGGAVLSVLRNGGANVNDVFGVTGSGSTGVNLSGGNLRIDTTIVGTISNSGGVLSITFAAGTTSAQAEQVVRAITYSNPRQSLGAAQHEFIDLRWTLDDGNTGAQGTGGAKQTTAAETVSLTGLNDAPLLSDTVLTLSQSEDAAAPSGPVGSAVSALTGGISDADSGAVRGIAITATDSSLGAWYYSVDNGTSWSTVGAVSPSSALLLRDSDRVYFQPTTDRNGSVAAGLTLRAWDRSTDSAGNRVDTSSSGGTSAFSVATDDVALAVGAINDAPTRLLAGVTLGSSLEDAASPNQATIASLFGSAFSDAADDQHLLPGGSSANGLAGIVITANAATAGQGQWQYSADGSSGWVAIATALSSSSGLFLPADYTLRFVPTADWNGTPGSLTVRLADDSTGSLPAAGAAIDVSNDSTLSGGTTRYSNSANAVSLSTRITAVNDAPTLGSATLNLSEDISSGANSGATINSLFSSRYGDATDTVSGGSTAQAFAGLAISHNDADPTTQGVWQYNAGGGWIDVSTSLSTSSALLLPTNASLRFAPVANYNGTPPALSVHAIDASAGSIAAVQGGQDISPVGGSSRYSAATTLTATVAAVNDAPSIAALSGTPTYVENGLPVRLDADGNVGIADVDLGNNWNGATLTVQRSGVSSAQDAFSLVDDDPGNVALGVQSAGSNLIVDGVTIGSFTQPAGRLIVTFNDSATAAAVGRVVGAVAYRNTSEAPPDSLQVNFVLSDQNTGGAQGSGGVLTTQSSIVVGITAINDAPTISALDATSGNTYVENGAPIQIDSNVVLADPELDGGNRWTGATLTVSRQGGASTDDVFGGTGALTLSGSGSGNVLVGGVTIGTYTASAGTLTVTFNAAATASRVDSAVQGLTYRNSSDAPPAAVSLQYVLSDQNTGLPGTVAQGQLSAGDATISALTASATTTINIARSNDAPVISAAPPAIAYTEQGTAVTVDASLTLSDADDADFASASVAIASPVAGDTLSVATAGTGISASFVGGVLTLTGVDSKAHYQQVLRSLTFSSSSDDPTQDATRTTRSLTLSVTDANADGSGARTTSRAQTILVAPVNDAPQIAAAGNTRSYSENAAPILLEPALILSDVDDTRLDQARLAFSGGFTSGDRLLFTDQSGISGHYDAASGVLTLSGNATLAAYQTALRSIAFESVSENPGATPRTLSWSVHDVNSDAAANGPQSSPTATTTIQVTPINDPPLALADADSLGKGSAVPATGQVLTNDTDIDGGTLVVTAFSSGGTPGTVGSALVGSNGYGQLVLEADGRYRFDVDTGNPTVAALGAGATLTEVFSYTISDGQGGSAGSTLTITIHGANDAPIAVADSNSVSEGAAGVSVPANGVLGNDSDLNGDALSVVGIAAGADQLPAGATPVPGGGSVTIGGVYGTLSVDAHGAYTYTLDNNKPAIDALAAGQSLNDSFTYVIADGKGGTASANVVITINGVNDPPDAINDSVSTPANGPGVSGNALSNDRDPDSSDSPVVSAVNGAPANVGLPVVGSYGSLTLHPDGHYSYVPNGSTAKTLAAGTTATDTFSYTISDGHGGSDTATITITLSGENDAPLAQPDSNTLTEDQVLASGNLISGLRVSGSGASSTVPGSTDSDPDTGDTLTVRAISDAEGHAGIIGSPLAGRYGSVTVDANGAYVYTLDSASPLVQALKAGETRVETFTYSVDDGHGGTANSTLAITIAGLNDPPTANDDAFDTVDTAGPPGGTPINGHVLLNDSDPDAGTTLQVTAINNGAGTVGGPTSGSFGTLTLNSDGTFSYAVDQSNGTVLALLRGQSLTETFTYRISDGAGGTSTATITFTIHGTNDAPSAGNDSNTIDEGQTSASGNVLNGDRTDGNGSSSHDPTAADNDPNGDPLTVTDITRPDGTASSVGAPLAGSFGRITLNADGTYSYVLDNASTAVQQLRAGETVTDRFVYTTTDGRGSFVDATVTITIHGANDAPIAVADHNDIHEDSTAPATGNVLDNDSDVDTNSTLTVTAVSGDISGTIGGDTQGHYGHLTLHADGTYSYALDNTLPAVQALKPGQTLNDVFTYTLSDGQGGSAGTTLAITIHGENDPPVAIADTLTVQEDGVPVDGLLTPGSLGQDSDVDGDPLTVTGFSNSRGVLGSVGTGSALGSALPGLYGQLSVAEDGHVRYTPDNSNSAVQALAAGQTLSEAFSYTISDGQGGFTSSTVTITLHGTNDAPTAGAAIPDQHNSDFAPASPLDVSGHFADVDLGDTLTYSAGGLPSGLSISSGGVINGTIDRSASVGGPSHDGIYHVTVTATDGNGLSVDQVFTWTVVNPSPVATDNSYTATANAGQTTIGNVLTDAPADSDPDGDSLQVVASRGAGSAGGQFTVGTDGSVRFDPNGAFTDLAVGQTRQTTYAYTLVDADGATDHATITVTVSGVNDPPSANPDTGNGAEDTVQTGNVLNNDSDPDTGDTRTVTQFVVAGTTVTVPAGPSGASTLIAGVGTLQVQADGSYRFTPLPDWNGSVPVVTYTVRDTVGDIATSTLSLTVTPVADITSDTATTSSTAPLTFDPLSGTHGTTADTFEDPAAAISAVGTPAHGSVQINPDGTLTYIPTPGYVGPDSFTYTVHSGGVNETATIRLTVSNAPPVATPDTGNGAEDTVQTGNVLNNDSDPDTGDTRTVTQFVVSGTTVTVPAGPSGASTLIAGVGTLQVQADGSYRFTPLPDWNGSVPVVTYTVRDVVGDIATSTLSLTVTPVNDPPIANPDTATGTAGAVTGNVLNNDHDADTNDGDTVTQFVVNGSTVVVPPGPAGAGIAIPGVGELTVRADGRFSLTPLPGWSGQVPVVTYTLRDAAGATADSTLAIRVAQPAVVPPPPQALTDVESPQWHEERPVDRFPEHLAQPFAPAQYVLQQVADCKTSLDQATSEVLHRLDPYPLGEIRSTIGNRLQTMVPEQFVLEQGVAFSRQLVAELTRRGLDLNDLRASDTESLTDDFSPFSPRRIGERPVNDRVLAIATSTGDRLPVTAATESPVERHDSNSPAEPPVEGLPAKPVPRLAAASFSEQLRQSQTQRRRIPLA